MTADNSILYFWNASCSVCEPLYAKLKVMIESDFPKLSLKKIDVSASPELRVQYRVFSSPVILLLIDGKEYLRTGGSTSLIELKQKVGRLYQIKFEN